MNHQDRQVAEQRFAHTGHGGPRVLQYRRRLEQVFLEDGQVMLDGLKDSIAQLRDSSHPQPLLNQAFRHAHSLKSEASFLGLTTLFEQAHGLEEFLSLARNAGLEGVGGVDTLIDATKAVQRAFAEAESELGRPNDEPQAGPSKLFRQGAGVAGPTPGGLNQLSRFERRVLREAEAQGEKVYWIRFEIVDPEPMLYARIYLVVCNLEQLVNVVKTNPPIDQVTDVLRSFEILCTARIGADVIADSIDVAAVENVRVEERSYEPVHAESDLEDDGYRSGFLAGLRHLDITISTRKYERLCLYTDELQHDLIEIERALDANRRWRGSALHRRLQTATHMIGVVGHTVTGTSQVRLYDVFDELQALVARLGGELGKLIRLKTVGGEITVFLPLARILAEVLAHLVRNAADHGLEPPEVRTAVGKSEYGEIRVEASVEERHTVVRIADNGRGIDDTAARERYRSVFDCEPPAALLEIITSPGFTSRPESSYVSGRGVGLDTVRHTIETVLGGRLELETQPGAGLELSIYVSRATRPVSVLIACFRSRQFAIPASEIIETLRIDPRYLSYDHRGNSHYRHNGEDLALCSIAEEEALEKLDHAQLYGVVTTLRDRHVVILAEELISEETVARDAERHEYVYSQTLGTSVRLLVPLRLRI